MSAAPEAEHEHALRTLVDHVQQARAERRTLSIRGGDTKRFYGNAPQGEPLELRALAGISSYEPTELVVTARAGTPLAELEATLAEQGQCLAFEPPRFASAGTDGASVPRGGTVGGMVAAGLSGPSRAAAGAVRDHVLGATLLNGKGELLSFGGQVMKNVAGYDVSRVLAGSLGILGVICEVSLKVLPHPTATQTLRFDLDQGAALQRVNEWGGQPLPLSATSYHDGQLRVRLSGAQPAVHAAMRKLGGELVPAADAFWVSVREHAHPFFAAAASNGQPLWRLSVRPTAPYTDLGGEQFIEWGGGLRWIAGSPRVDGARLRAFAIAQGGHAAIFRGGDRSADVFQPLPAPLAGLHARLKAAFDPRAILNRGRLLPSF